MYGFRHTDLAKINKFVRFSLEHDGSVTKMMQNLSQRTIEISLLSQQQL